MTIGWRWRTAVLGVGMSACTNAELVESPALFSESDAVERVLTGAVFDTLWVLDGPSDTLLAALQRGVRSRKSRCCWKNTSRQAVR